MVVRIIGVDLAGVSTRPTGLAMLYQNTIETNVFHTDFEILEFCTMVRPQIVAIDAPLSKPSEKGLRECDRILIRRGLRVFPPFFGGMRKLTERGIRLARVLKRKNIEVIEVHPKTSGILLFNSKNRDVWVKQITRLGFKIEKKMTVHEVDAVLAALTGWLYVRGKTESVGKKAKIIVPLRGALEKI